MGIMRIRFYTDEDTGLAHTEAHGVDPTEVLEVFQGRTQRGHGRDGAQIAEGQIRSGRYLRVIYRDNEFDGSILVITAYELTGKAKAAYRRRNKRR